MNPHITPALCQQMLRQLQDGMTADCLIMLDDGHDIYMHQCVMAINAPCFYALAMERGAQLRSVLYLRVHDITNTSMRLIRKFIYLRRLVMPTPALLPLLADGIVLRVFDPNAVNRFGNSPAADHYLVRYSTDQDTMMQPGTLFIEDGIHWEIANHGQQLVRDTLTQPVEAVPSVAWLGLVEYVPQQAEFYDAQNVPQGYDEAVLFERGNEEQSDDDDFEMACDEMEMCNCPPGVLGVQMPMGDYGNGAANNAPQEAPANATNRSRLVNAPSTSYNTGNGATVRRDAPVRATNRPRLVNEPSTSYNTGIAALERRDAPVRATNRPRLANEPSTSYNTGNEAQVRRVGPITIDIDHENAGQGQGSSRHQPYINDDPDQEQEN